MCRWVLLLLVALPAVAVADDDHESDPVAEAKPLREDPMVFTDGKGHYYAFSRTHRGDHLAATYYGDKSVLYRSTNVLHHDDGTAEASAGVRGMLWHFELGLKEVKASCGQRKVTLAAVPREAARRLVRDATIKLAPSWDRQPLRLARDDTGVYYYVDGILRPDTEASDHRLFVGRRGGARRVKLKDIIIDSAGELYISDLGTFKVTNPPKGSATPEETFWIVKGVSVRLTTVPPASNATLVHASLGAYDGEKLGFPCDVM
jgi:hypothetical protein